jgi:hypothetical protein
MISFESFKEIWIADFEFVSLPGELPEPVCITAKELCSGTWRVQWLVGSQNPPPLYPTGKDTLFIAYFASAEMGCHLQLGWDIPCNILDLYAEFRNHTNGLPTPSGSGLLGASAYFGIQGCTAGEKTEMRDLVLRGGPWTPEEQLSILTYCMSDVEACERLFYAMEGIIDLPRALMRGRYMGAVAWMERNGVPIDRKTHRALVKHFDPMKAMLVDDIDRNFGVYEGTTFKVNRWIQWVNEHGVSWPLLDTGYPSLDDETFRELATIYPEIAPIKDLRYVLGQMKLNDLAVGSDGRNRCLLSPFRSVTGRNQPSSTKYIFGPAIWLRNLIQPEPGKGVAYVDYAQQEFGIAAALSGDFYMLDAYRSGDPYLMFAIQAGAVPEDATKQTHPHERELFKQCTLAVQYGMGAHSLSRRIGEPTAVAQNLLDLHRKTYAAFWKWSDSVVTYAALHNKIWTRFGWYYHVSDNFRERTVRNFLMQANGAEILRLACCRALDAGIKVCAPVHDAILIEAPADKLSSAIATTQREMGEASKIVLDGFELRTDADQWVYPDRYSDPRGTDMWKRVMAMLARCEHG